jgi:hypothetical protein
MKDRSSTPAQPAYGTGWHIDHDVVEEHMQRARHLRSEALGELIASGFHAFARGASALVKSVQTKVSRDPALH